MQRSACVCASPDSCNCLVSRWAQTTPSFDQYAHFVTPGPSRNLSYPVHNEQSPLPQYGHYYVPAQHLPYPSHAGSSSIPFPQAQVPSITTSNIQYLQQQSTPLRNQTVPIVNDSRAPSSRRRKNALSATAAKPPPAKRQRTSAGLVSGGTATPVAGPAAAELAGVGPKTPVCPVTATSPPVPSGDPVEHPPMQLPTGIYSSISHLVNEI
ncbi:hypothetical protein HYDPIDRAFT_34294 [Hydnomerulius pinastri MD-312]|uniref:Uncharacterized protein n=1 Tax=Hydnomerulius pinastri MD-312 TaxID=994086 RepID=A0A0C9VY62_9AGAM|nr:hypothetical protein HYDPIDRAFT_34294 [Hydnomerulius pinastri MD-312]